MGTMRSQNHWNGSSYLRGGTKTYATSGSTLTTSAGDGGLSGGSYCVVGNRLYLYGIGADGTPGLLRATRQ